MTKQEFIDKWVGDIYHELKTEFMDDVESIRADQPDKPTDDWNVLKSIIEKWKFLTPDKDGWSFPYHTLKRIKDCTDYDDGDFVSEEQVEDVLMAIIQIATYPKQPLPTPPQKQKP